MNYNYPDNVPDIIENLTVEEQKVWISAFNSVVDSGKTEKEASQVAWTQITGYEESEDGVWIKSEKKLENIKMSKEIINTSEDGGFFKSFIALEHNNGKVKIFTKSVGDKKVKYLRGVASNTAIDKEDEKMSKAFINKMKTTSLGMNVFSEHEHSIEKTLGYVESVSGDEDSMILDVALEDENENDLVKKILKKIEHGINIGFSVGGRITKAAVEFNEDVNKTIRELLDGDIFEVSLTAMPAGNGTWVAPITKSLNNWLDKLEKNTNITNTKNPNKIEDSVSKSSTDETTPTKELSKILEEIVQRDEIQSKLYDFFWAFRDALYNIVYDENMDGTKKKEKIISLGAEFGTRIEEISATIAELESMIQDEINN